MESNRAQLHLSCTGILIRIEYGGDTPPLSCTQPLLCSLQQLLFCPEMVLEVRTAAAAAGAAVAAATCVSSRPRWVHNTAPSALAAAARHWPQHPHRCLQPQARVSHLACMRASPSIHHRHDTIFVARSRPQDPVVCRGGTPVAALKSGVMRAAAAAARFDGAPLRRDAGCAGVGLNAPCATL